MRKKVMMVFGTRPEAIKMAPLYHELKKSKELEVVCCVTAQHREMLDDVLNLFDIHPEIDLDIMKSGQDLFDITASIILKMKKVLEINKPDFVLVHGDTSTTFVTSLACFYSNIKVGHVEAGLRTFNLRSPFPEEFNRVATGLIADFHFAPTEVSKNNLIRDNVDIEKILVTGNTVIDALFFILTKIDSNRDLRNKIQNSLSNCLDFDFINTKYVLITGHRRENFGKGFLNICDGIKNLALKYPQFHFIYPVHLNPNVQEPVNKILSGIKNIHLIEPQKYESFIYLLKNAFIILTDSGGIQEEAPSLSKPVLVMRDTSERPEAIEAGTVKLVGTSAKNIFLSVSELIDDEEIYLKMSRSNNPYGDGKASKKIVTFLENL